MKEAIQSRNIQIGIKESDCYFNTKQIGIWDSKEEAKKIALYSKEKFNNNKE